MSSISPVSYQSRHFHAFSFKVSALLTTFFSCPRYKTKKEQTLQDVLVESVYYLPVNYPQDQLRIVPSADTGTILDKSVCFQKKTLL
jgi:hypothetical protein